MFLCIRSFHFYESFAVFDCYTFYVIVFKQNIETVWSMYLKQKQ